MNWCKSKEFGCECGRDDFEPCPLPHPRDATKSCACRFALHEGWLRLLPESECGYHRVIRESGSDSSEADASPGPLDRRDGFGMCAALCPHCGKDLHV